jgi:hypothetical protein
MESMWQVGCSVLAGIAVSGALGAVGGAQENAQLGWLEGTVTNAAGQAIDRQWPCQLTLYPAEGEPVRTQADTAKGGFFSAKGLAPGVYEVRVDGGTIAGTSYRPQRIWGVAIAGGVRSVLKITLHEAKTPAEKDSFEEIGQPTVPTQPVLFLPDELDRLRKQLDDLTKLVEALQKQVEALKANH